MIDIKTMYDGIVALQPTRPAAPLTPLQMIEEAEKARAIDVEHPNGAYSGLTLSPSPARIKTIEPGRIVASISYNAASGEGYVDNYIAEYSMLVVDYDIAFDNSLYGQVRLIHNNTLVEVGGEILKFNWKRHDLKTIHHHEWRSYTFQISLKLSHIALLRKEPTASTIGAPTPRNSQCFIATAAFGGEERAEVDALRRFRDETLLKIKGGREVVAFYERVSPPLAAGVRIRPRLAALIRHVVRYLVLPVCFAIQRVTTGRLTRHAADSGACNNERRCG